MQRVMLAWMARQFDVYFSPLARAEIEQVVRDRPRQRTKNGHSIL